MRITKLQIKNFRNIKHLSVVPNPGMNAFWGSNGEGKTNLLEAIFALLRGTSFRPYSDKGDWFQEGQTEPTWLGLDIEDKRGIATTIQLNGSRGHRWQSQLNEKKTNSSTLKERFPVIVFSPDDHAIIRSGPERRRQFLDEVLGDISPGYQERLDRFERTLKQRNELLKRDLTLEQKRLELKSWNQLLAEAAFSLYELRIEYWPLFTARVESLARRLLQRDETKISLKYQRDIDNPKSVSEIAKVLLDSLERDLATGWTHRGPQRDDFEIQFKGLEARSKASQGEARLLALILKWTHVEWIHEERNESPLFLIDDFSTELDEAHRGLLLSLIQGLKGQVFLTGTDPKIVDLTTIIEYTQYKVKNGFIDLA